MEREVTETRRGYDIYIEQDETPLDPRKEYDNVGTMVCWSRQYSLGDEQPSGINMAEYLVDLVTSDPAAMTMLKSIARHAKKVRSRAHRAWWRKRDAILDEIDHLIGYEEVLVGIQELAAMGRVPQPWPWHDGESVGAEELVDELNLTCGTLAAILNRVGWLLFELDLRDLSYALDMRIGDFGNRFECGFIYVRPETIEHEWGTGRDARQSAISYLRGEVKTYSSYLEGEVYGYIVENPADKTEDESVWGYYGYKDCLEEARQTADWLADHRPAKIAAELQVEQEFAYA
jgi:hypothetical protein